MLKIALVLIALAFSLALFGCVEQFTGKSDVRQQCSQQLSSCQKNCDDQNYFFGGTVEECKSRCSNDYQTCMS